MTLNKIASELAKREGKKSQVRIGDIREILKILIEWDSEFNLGGPFLELTSRASDARDKRLDKEAKQLRTKKGV